MQVTQFPLNQQSSFCLLSEFFSLYMSVYSFLRTVHVEYNEKNCVTFKEIDKTKDLIDSIVTLFNTEEPKGFYSKCESKHIITELLPDLSQECKIQLMALILRSHKTIDCTKIIEAVGNKKLPPSLLTEYCQLFNMQGLDAEDAYRLFLSNNTLIGESQIINRAIKAISTEYYKQNNFTNKSIKNEEASETLFSTMTLLNTMHHNPNANAHVQTYTDHAIGYIHGGSEKATITK
jgi:Sec7-like guanine-nucleotide exchange factor